MEITEIRMMTVPPRQGNDSRLLAFASITFDGVFVVHDLKVIDGNDHVFVSMPCREVADACSHCGRKNVLRANFCNWCKGHMDPDRAPRDENNKSKLFVDVAHPITRAFRDEVERAVLAEYRRLTDVRDLSGVQASGAAGGPEAQTAPPSYGRGDLTAAAG